MTPARLILSIAFIAFISLGLPDTVLGVAWPSIRAHFSLPVGGLGWVLVASGAGYFVSSSNVARMMRVIRLGTLLAFSTLLVAAGLFGYAFAPSWPMFLAAAPLIGLGSGAIDAALNHYAAHEFSVRNVNWLHACYGIGATLGPVIMVSAIQSDASWPLGYSLLGVILLLLSTLFAGTRQIWRPSGNSAEEVAQPQITGLRALRHPIVRLQVVTFFFYTGLEASIGQWAFTLQTQLQGLSQGIAGIGTILYWGGLTVGRIALGHIAGKIDPDRLLRFAILTALAGTFVFLLSSSVLSVIALAVIGFSLAPVYPTLMSRTPARVGNQLSAQSIGFQVSAAMAGVLVLPSVAGFFADFRGLNAISISIALVAIVLVTCHERLLVRGAEK